ncbi:diacylglycerol/lipid kinase family protein [Nonomuraea gerenzanensis]|uniref:Possible diacylglycerol kinase, catalytic region n=1 Tax=Nonomuraea gerenzanensis TaxID=93944 RepID=A0A1M4EE50_9ACTN|nr:diacylglycerol kinase family protein [Nonomuraea gerenzanensis]SBO96853.1 possible diacylglycerol kinase, catalytic region [Nonomuraea gerenzanensis]
MGRPDGSAKIPASRFEHAQAWTARLALALAAAVVPIMLAAAGFQSITLLALGLGALAVASAAVWVALTHRGLVRGLAVVVAVLAPLAVLVRYAVAGALWPMIVSAGLLVLAAVTGRVAMAMGVSPARFRGRAVPAPKRPYLIMNPRSGGGKVDRFGLVAKAGVLGAEVQVLDPDRPQDVAQLARDAVARGADLLGVAGGDGTQALVAAVAAEHDVPFMVIPAGTRNHLAMDLGLDRDDPSTSLRALDDGVEISMDLGLVADRTFVNNASFGAYAAIVQSPAYRATKLHTALDLLPELLTHRAGARLVARAGEVVIEAPQAVLVSNNPYLAGRGGGFGRRLRLDTGVLGVLGVTADTALKAAALVWGRRSAALTSFTAQEVVVDADEPEIPVGVDGEALLLPTPVRCRVRPGALRVRTPRGSGGERLPVSWRTVWGLAFPPRRTGRRRTHRTAV